MRIPTTTTLTTTSTRTLLLLLSLFVLNVVASFPATAQPAGTVGLVGIVEGGATLIRQTTRHTLAEGVTLNEQDIVETAPGAFVQLELPGGVLVGMGDATRLMLQPKVSKGLSPQPLYLLQGWLKTSGSGNFGYASPGFEIATQGAVAVVHATATQYEVFIESGAAKLSRRDGPTATAQLAAGDFAQKRDGAAPTTSRRPAPDFLSKLPRQFRDSLPARAAQLAKRSVAPKPLGEIAYADVDVWLRTEPGLRLALLPLWRGRAVDPAFRAGAKADLAQHPEWEQAADPEGYARRLAEEAERRRAREAARQAAIARAAAARAAEAEAAASTTGSGAGK